MRSFALLIPGLFGPSEELSVDNVPQLPALELLLARAKRKTQLAAGLYPLLFDLFAVGRKPEQNLPIAALTRLIDDDVRPEGTWMRADPVHLSPGRDGLFLMDSSVFSLTQRESILLAAPLQQFFAERDWQFEIPVAKRWYLKMQDYPDVMLADIGEVAARNIQPFMPRGEGSSRWEKLMNDVQMLLHDSEVNHERQKQGQLPINSLWFWGAGQLPKIPARQWSALFSDEAVSRGLAMLSGTPFTELPEMADTIINADNSDSDILVLMTDMLAYSRYTDVSAWRTSIEKIEQDWFEPLLAALRDGMIKQLTIFTNNEQFTIKKSTLLKLWRTSKSLLTYR